MPLPAWMICLTASGASSGGSATPLGSAIAWVTALEPPLAGCAPWIAAEAARVGFASPAPPRLGSTAVSGVVGPPATGCTTRARVFDGSGGRPAVVTDAAAGAGGPWADADARAGVRSFPAAPSASQPPSREASPTSSAAIEIRRIHLGWRPGRGLDVRLPTTRPHRRDHAPA